MKEYNRLKGELTEERHKLHKKLLKDNKKVFRWLDVLAILVILMNFGAVFTTNMLVMKTNAEEVKAGVAEPVVLKEVNPVQAKLNNYEQHPEANSLINALMKQVFLWLMLIGLYMWQRMKVFTNQQLILFATMVWWYFLVIGWDFFNDFGFYIAKVIWG